MQCRHQVLITTGIEVGHETGVRDDQWWHCHLCHWNDHGLPAEETFLTLQPEPPLSGPGPFLTTRYVKTLSPTVPNKMTHLDNHKDECPFLFTLPLLLCPLGLDLIPFLSDLQIDENLSSSPSLPEPQTVARAGHGRAVPAATAERGVIYIFIRNSVLLARDAHFWL